MRMERTVTLLLLFALGLPGFAGEANFLVRKRVSEVQMMLVATDQHNRPVQNLSPADIMVLEDGQPIPRFGLRSAADLPLRIAVVVDVSDSTLKAWTAIKATLAPSLQAVMRPGDELLVVAFNNKVALEKMAFDPVELERLLANPPAGGLTALYDTVYQVCDRPLFRDELEPHRSAVILFSDGEDDLSIRSLNDAIARAQRRGVSIYTVASHDPKKQSRGDAVLRDLASTTGGRDYIVKNSGQLGTALAAINEELRSSYLLYYRVPEETGKQVFRRVRVISTPGRGSQLRSRAGYFTAP